MICGRHLKLEQLGMLADHHVLVHLGMITGTWTDPPGLFVWIFFINSMAGLAAALRSSHELNWRNVVSSMINSGFAGLIIALVWYRHATAEPYVYFMIGISLMAGIGGVASIDFIVLLSRKYIVSHFHPNSSGNAGQGKAK